MPSTTTRTVKAKHLKPGQVIILRLNPPLLMPVLSVTERGGKIVVGNERNGETLADPEMKFKIQHQ